MLKTKNKILLAGSIVIAMSGMSSAQAAPAGWCAAGDTAAQILSEATAAVAPNLITVSDIKSCTITAVGTSTGAALYSKFAAIATVITQGVIGGGTAGPNGTDTIGRAADDISGQNGATTASSATAFYLSVLTNGTNTEKLAVADAVAKTLIADEATTGSSVMLTGAGTGTGVNAYIGSPAGNQEGLICRSYAINPTAFATIVANGSGADAKAAVDACRTIAPPPVNNGGDPYLSRNNLGQVLIYPYYTTRGGKKSLINVFNTSGRTIAAKVRFHESHNSRDVLDFTVVLSPYDKWSGTIRDSASGPIFVTSDTTCTIPAIASSGQLLNTEAYNKAGTADLDTDQTNDRLKEGYVEIIAMGAAVNENTTIAINAKHGGVTTDGSRSKPKNCAAIAADNGPFAPLTSFEIDQTGLPLAKIEFEGLKSGENPLRGTLSIFDSVTGVGFGTSALAIADFRDPTKGDDLITAQSAKFFHEPTIASRDGTWTVTGLKDVEDALTAGTVINEWANNPINGAQTDWILQFPTKAFHVDCGDTLVAGVAVRTGLNIQAARNAYRNNPCPAGSTDARLAPFEAYFGPNGSPITLGIDLYDNEENHVDNSVSGPGISFSPKSATSPDAIQIRWESNIVTFAGAGGTSVMSSSSPEQSLYPNDPTSAGRVPGNNGMAMIKFTKANGGLPVIGFATKQRNQGQPDRAYGQTILHSYK